MDVGRPRAWAGARLLRETERLHRDLDGPVRVHGACDLTKTRVQASCRAIALPQNEQRLFNAIAASHQYCWFGFAPHNAN